MSDEYLDTKNIIKKLDQLPLCSFFIETRKKAKCRSAMAWLKVCDDDTIKMIIQYANKFVNAGEENPVDNKTTDIFDKHFEKTYNFKDDDDCFGESEEMDDESDFYFLTCLILAWEHDKYEVPDGVIEEGFLTLGLYTNIEALRRSNLVKIKGSGTLLSKNTSFALTKAGRKNGKNVMACIHREIKKAIGKK